VSKKRVYPPKKGKFSGENDEAVDLGVPFWKKKHGFPPQPTSTKRHSPHFVSQWESTLKNGAN
jgi:hypothetical protein